MAAVQRQEERADRLLKSATDRDVTEEESSAWIRDCSVSEAEKDERFSGAEVSSYGFPRRVF